MTKQFFMMCIQINPIGNSFSAEPFIKDLVIEKGQPNTSVIIVDVGDRPE